MLEIAFIVLSILALCGEVSAVPLAIVGLITMVVEIVCDIIRKCR